MQPSSPERDFRTASIPPLEPFSNPHRILVADDDPVTRDSLRILLEADPGLRVTTASDGAEALEALIEGEYHLLITDLRMPRLDGMELIEEVQKRQLPVKVIVITGFGRLEDAVRAMKLGAFDFLQVPVEIEQLRLQIRQALRQPLATEATRCGLQTPLEDQTFSALTVVTRYPAPIAIPYLRFCREEDRATRLRMLFSSLESTLRYLVMIGVSDLFQCLSTKGDEGEELPGHPAFEFLRRPTAMTLGRWHGALQETARALQREPRRVLVELPEVCRPGGSFDEQIAWLIHYRNECLHEAGSITLSPEECQERKRRARPYLEEALNAVRFTCNYPLGFVRRRTTEGEAT